MARKLILHIPFANISGEEVIESLPLLLDDLKKISLGERTKGY